MQQEIQHQDELNDRLIFCSKILEKCGCMHTKYWNDQLNKVKCEIDKKTDNNIAIDDTRENII